MKFEKSQTLESIASIIGAKYVGPAGFPITGINEIHKVEPGDIVFVDHPKYYDKALNCDATVVLINKEVDCPEGKALLISDDPFRDFNAITRHFNPVRVNPSPISSEASIDNSSFIAPGVSVGNKVIIGKNCIIHPGVVIYDDVVIGDNVIIHANSVIGAFAFYFKKRPEGFDRLHTCGRVIIEDDVEIGATCTIDRGVTGDTVIGKGTKMDNQVHVGHDTVIGKKCLFAAQVGIAGCVVVEDEVTLWGQVGVPSGLTLAKGTVVLGQSGLTKDTEAGKTYFGSPAEESRAKYKEMAALRMLIKKNDNK